MKPEEFSQVEQRLELMASQETIETDLPGFATGEFFDAVIATRLYINHKSEEDGIVDAMVECMEKYMRTPSMCNATLMTITGCQGVSQEDANTVIAVYNRISGPIMEAAKGYRNVTPVYIPDSEK